MARVPAAPMRSVERYYHLDLEAKRIVSRLDSKPVQWYKNRQMPIS